MSLREFAGAAAEAALMGPIGVSDVTLAVDTLEGWPTGAVGPFAAIIGKGLPNEEKVLCTSASGGSITMSVRGYDGTAPQSHAATEKVRHCSTAIDLREANQHVNANSGVHGLDVGDRVAGLLTAGAFENKVLSGLLNTFTNLPRTAIPEVDSLLTSIVAKNTSQDTDLAARYTKAEADVLFRLISDSYNKAGVDSAIAAAIAAYYTKVQADARFRLIADSYTKADADGKFRLIADSYTKTEVDTYRKAHTVVSGSLVAAPDGSGLMHILYNVSFAAKPVVVVSVGDNNAANWMPEVDDSTVTTSGCSVQILNAGSGGIVTSGTRRLNWIAAGALA